MSVMLITTRDKISIDLFYEECPLSAKNFLWLSETKYYDGCLFFNVQKDYIIQTGDPTNTGRGGASVFEQLYGQQSRFFQDEIVPSIRHDSIGLVSWANAGEDTNCSQFFFTTRADNLTHLDDKNTCFGQVQEGFDILASINGTDCDKEGRPLQNIRILQAIVLIDPFKDEFERLCKEGRLVIPEKKEPLPLPKEFATRIEDGEPLDEYDGMTKEEFEEKSKAKEAKSREEVLEIIGDVPDAEYKPPENVLFVCKINPITDEHGLELFFGKYGDVKSVDIIRDWKTGDSLQYAFVEFEDKEACENAYRRADGVQIDDRRIHVDFSQSVTQMAWDYFKNKQKYMRGGVRTSASMSHSSQSASENRVYRGPGGSAHAHRQRHGGRSRSGSRSMEGGGGGERRMNDKRARKGELPGGLVLKESMSHGHGQGQDYSMVFDGDGGADIEGRREERREDKERRRSRHKRSRSPKSRDSDDRCRDSHSHSHNRRHHHGHGHGHSHRR